MAVLLSTAVFSCAPDAVPEDPEDDKEQTVFF